MICGVIDVSHELIVATSASLLHTSLILGTYNQINTTSVTPPFTFRFNPTIK